MKQNGDIVGLEAGATLCSGLTDNPPVSILAMKILEFIKQHRIPQKEMAKRIGISHAMYRKKVNGTQTSFTDEELNDLKSAVLDYLEDLIRKFHKNVTK